MGDVHQGDAELSRPVATSRDKRRGDEYLAIKEALAMFAARGRSVTERTLQRYCEKHHLEGQKRITAEGGKWFVLRSYVVRRLDELDEFDRLKLSRPVATSATSRRLSGPKALDRLSSTTRDKRRQKMCRHLSIARNRAIRARRR